jgi:hypothetical protein
MHHAWTRGDREHVCRTRLAQYSVGNHEVDELSGGVFADHGDNGARTVEPRLVRSHLRHRGGERAAEQRTRCYQDFEVHWREPAFFSQAQAGPQRQFSPQAQAVTAARSWHPHAQTGPAQFSQSQDVFFASFMMLLRLG